MILAQVSVLELRDLYTAFDSKSQDLNWTSESVSGSYSRCSQHFSDAFGLFYNLVKHRNEIYYTSTLSSRFKPIQSLPTCCVLNNTFLYYQADEGDVPGVFPTI